MSDRVAGLRIRYLRKKRGLSLQQVAAHMGRSVGFISQIERNISSPADEDLASIAALLEVDVEVLYTDAKPTASHPIIVRLEDRASLDYRPGINDQLISPSIAGSFHMLYTEIEPGASSSDQLKDEFGEQGGLVLDGELELTVNDEIYIVKTGDSFQFPSATPHRYENKTDKPTKLVWIVSVK